jgi:uncharacterized protein
MNKCKQEIINKTKEFVKKELDGETTGHDWWHAWRVWNMARKIAKQEGGDLFVIEMAALLHDIDDWKFSKNNNYCKTEFFLKKIKIDKDNFFAIMQIIKNISFKGGGVKPVPMSFEGKIVQDADKLDAIGAIGIARVFAYSGSVKRQIHNPKIKPKNYKSFKAYKNSESTSINHFYEKLLLLKNRMNMKTAKKIALKRHKFIEVYLKEFFNEWKGGI